MVTKDHGLQNNEKRETMNFCLVIHLNRSVSADIIKILQIFAQVNNYESYFDNDTKQDYLDFSFKGSSLKGMKALWKNILLEVNQENSPIAFLKNEWIVMLCENEEWDYYILLNSAFEPKGSKYIADNFLDDNFSWNDYLANLPHNNLCDKN